MSIIISILVKTLDPKCIYLFGSRATDNYNEYSDFDIAVEGSKGSFRKMRKVKQLLDEKLGIYSCDLIKLEKSGADFKALVQKQGKVIYEERD